MFRSEGSLLPGGSVALRRMSEVRLNAAHELAALMAWEAGREHGHFDTPADIYIATCRDLEIVFSHSRGDHFTRRAGIFRGHF